MDELIGVAMMGYKDEEMIPIAAHIDCNDQSLRPGL